MLTTTVRHAWPGAGALVLALVLTGCGAQGDVTEPAAVGTPEPETPAQPHDDQAGPPDEEPPTQPDDKPPAQPDEEQPAAVASPLDIPLPINVLSGSIYGDRIGEIEALVREACGGDLCLTIVKKGQETTLSEGDVCDRIDTVEGTVFDDQGQGHLVVDPGSDFVVLVNVRCEDVPIAPVEDEGSTSQPSAGPSSGRGSPDGHA